MLGSSNAVRERPNIVWFRSINCVNRPRQCTVSNKVLRSLCFFSVILIGLKRFAKKHDPTGANAEEAPGPPAESECLTFQSTSTKKGSGFLNQLNLLNKKLQAN
ncbi:hypothetical protein CW306_16725 [Bacillus sp. BA3]|nr:hypothetical protein CW306_16725 [Bacillus sp. BA3]